MTPTPQELESSRLEHEIEEIRSRTQWQREKADAEIRELNRPWFQRAGLYASLSPVVLGLLGLVFSWASGWFDVQNKKLEAEKTLLSYQKATLEADRTRIQKDVDEANRAKTELEKANASLRAENGTLAQETQRLRGENEELGAKKLELERSLGETSTALAASQKSEKEARESEAITQRRMPMIAALEQFRSAPAISVSLGDPSGEALLRFAKEPSEDRDFFLGRLRELLAQPTLDESHRCTLLCLLHLVTSEPGLLDSAFALESARACDLSCARNLAQIAPPERLLAFTVEVSSSVDAVGMIGYSILCERVAPWACAPERVADTLPDLIRILEFCRRSASGEEGQEIARTYALTSLARFSPFAGACLAERIYRETANESVKLEIATSLQSILLVGAFREDLLAPGAEQCQSVQLLGEWVRDQDPQLVALACEGDLRELLSAERRASLLVR